MNTNRNTRSHPGGRRLSAARRSAAEFESRVIGMRVFVDSNEPLRYAEAIYRNDFCTNGTPTIRRWRDSWWLWEGKHYREIGIEELSGRVRRFLDGAYYQVEGVAKKATHTRRQVDEVIAALGALPGVLLHGEAGCWLDGAIAPLPGPTLPCRNGLLFLESRTLIPHDAHFFQTFSVPYEYDPDAPAPRTWMDFLASLWDEQPECIALLREWFGYILSGDLSHQKIMLLIGPKRAGKGTIVRVLMALVGEANVATPNLSTLDAQFGLSPLLNKVAAIVSDARLGGRSDEAIIVERLLSISGQDSQQVDRKYKEPLNVPLRVRFMLVSNEVPRLRDSSGALISRFLLLPLSRSFYGEEDRGLQGRIEQELPGILNWALDGYELLSEQGRFTTPACADEVLETFADLASPISAFIRERCEIGQYCSVSAPLIYEAWLSWCKDAGYEHPGSAPQFGQKLHASVAGLRIKRPRTGGKQIRIYHGIRLQIETG